VLVSYSVAMFLDVSSKSEGPEVLHVSQWSGYIVASDMQNRSSAVTRVSGSWIVPEVNPSDNMTFSGIWVGVGGYGEDTLIQTGTEQEYLDGEAVYYAWYELLPDYLVPIHSIHVQPGDTMTASIRLVNDSTDTWSITIWDVTRGEKFEKTVVYNSSRLSAEWVVERPKVNDTVSALADFGSVTFTECKATVDGVIGVIGNFSYSKFVMHEEDTPLVAVSSLDGDESGFTVTYLEQPSPTESPDDLTPVAVRSGAFLVCAATVVYKSR